MDMMTIEDLANALANKMKLEPNVAKLFVTNLFDVVRQAVETERIVKVKGLGTFKLIEVSARESVNVNNGERVIIGSHGKISFTPDPIMKELVNKPFSQFETVVLNDGVDFDDDADTNAETQPEADEPQNEEMSIENEEDVPQQADVPKQATDENPEDVMPLHTDNEEVAEIQDNADKNDIVTDALQSTGDAQSQSTDTTDVESQVEDGLAVNDGLANNVSSVEIAPENEQRGSEEDEKIINLTNVNDASQNLDNGKQAGSIAKFAKMLILCVTVVGLMAISAYIGFLYGGLQANTGQIDESTHKENTNNASPKDEIIAKSTTVDSIKAADSLQANVANAKQDTIDKAPQAVPEVKHKGSTMASSSDISSSTISKSEESLAFDSEKYNKMDIRIRTGAYDIVGTAEIITVKSGQSLSDISNRYLGPGMECYIETYNNLNGDSHLIAGQKLKIPKLKLKRKK